MNGRRLRLWIRAQAAAVAPAIATLVAFTMSPMGADLALADVPAAAQRPAGLVYGGTMSNGWPLVVEVTRNGRMVKGVVGAVSASCDQGGIFSFPSTWRYLRINRHGAFKASYRDNYLDEGTEVTVSETFVGRFNRNRTKVTGQWRDTHTFTAPDGTVEVCDTGSLSFSARQ